MEIAKALILAGGGHDDGPWPSAPGAPRHLFPVANRPILKHNLVALRASGVLEATIMVEPDGAEAIEHALGDGRDVGVSVQYATWQASAGVRGALAAGRTFVGDEPVLVQRGDALLLHHLGRHISAFAREGLDALTLRLTGAAPSPDPGHLLSSRAVSILLDGPQSAISPGDGVRARGGRVRTQDIDGVLSCVGGQEALLTSNRAMLEGLTTSVHPASVEDSVLQGPVEIHPCARVVRSTLRGPLIIGPGARIVDAYVGPYTSIGADVTVEGAEIEHSIVLPEAELHFVGMRLESSVIGRGARIARTFQAPAALRVVIGDGAELVLA